MTGSEPTSPELTTMTVLELLHSQRIKVEAAIKLATARRSPGLSAIPVLPLMPIAFVFDGLAEFAAGLTVLG